MDLYNILSINGIDIDEYLNGGSAEDINEIKSNVININNVLTYNMTSFKNNIRYFDSNYTSILNNYMINNCSDVYNKLEFEQLYYNSTILYDNITKYIDAFKLNSEVEMCVYNNCVLPFFELYMYYTLLSEPYNLNFEYKSLIISLSSNGVGATNYLINTTYTLNDIKIYYTDHYSVENARYISELFKDFKALSFNIIGDISFEGNLQITYFMNNMKILNSCSIWFNMADNLKCSYMFNNCNFSKLYFVYSIVYYHGNTNTIIISTLFNNCTIDDLYLFDSQTLFSVNKFINNTNNINNIYILGENSNTLDYVNNYKITGDLTSRVKTFTTYNLFTNM